MPVYIPMLVVLHYWGESNKEPLSAFYPQDEDIALLGRVFFQKARVTPGKKLLGGGIKPKPA